ncbi:MAG TPA: methylmalonyl-CoA epimerase [Bacteroidetes bacterium]|nr:methylmalonyl-CoA epimerase [Bacteroidota bacterium]
MHIDHIGIAVENIEEAIKKYESLLNTPCFKREIVESENVETAFFQTGESKVELLAGTTPDSVISKYVAKRGEGMHHVAFEVDDIKGEIQRYILHGYQMLSESPKQGVDQKLIVFLHPKEAHGVLIELCQSVK